MTARVSRDSSTQYYCHQINSSHWDSVTSERITYPTPSTIHCLSQEATLRSDLSPSLPHHCPLDKDELGRNTWGFLHTMAANYPERPSTEQQSLMKTFVKTFSEFYPCEVCAFDFRQRSVRISNHKLLKAFVFNLGHMKLGIYVYFMTQFRFIWVDAIAGEKSGI